MEEQRVRIVGGSSLRGRISILSDKFTATARSDNYGNICCKVTPCSRFSTFLCQNKYFPIPRIARLTVFFYESFGKIGKVILGIYLGMTIGFLIQAAFQQKDSLPINQLNQQSFSQTQVYVLAASAAFICAVLLYTKRYIAPWHGAEHMAIAAYERSGSVDIKSIAKESPIHRKCGGRLALPFIIGAITSSVIDNLLVTIIILEIVLWIDVLVGWDRVPLASQASRLLQKHITTRQPGDKELRTAQFAMRALVTAHRQADW